MAKIQITSDTFKILYKLFVDKTKLTQVEEKDVEAELYTIKRNLEKENKRFEPKAKNGEKVYFDVFYNDKAEAKNLGARWDGDAKAWYAVEGTKECDALRMVFNIQDIDTMRKK